MPDQRIVQKRGANHTLHIILTVCTCGLWAITGWPIAAAMGRKTTTTVWVPPPGQVPPAQQPYGYPPQQGYQAPPYYGPQQPPAPPGQYGQPRQ